MNAYHPYSLFPLGDAALLIDFGNTIDEEVNRKVLQLFHQLKAAPHPALTDLIPAYSSLTLCYDVTLLYGQEVSPFDQLAQWIESLPELTAPVETKNRLSIPVCYALRYAPDLENLAQQSGLSVADVIRIHTAKTYRVYMLGFLPGFAYMGSVDKAIAAPRHSKPRTSVPAGSVGIAGFQTGIYPLTAPGGWQLIGRTPLTLFRPEEEPPVLFQPGDEIVFYPITEDEFTHYQSRTA